MCVVVVMVVIVVAVVMVVCVCDGSKLPDPQQFCNILNVLAKASPKLNTCTHFTLRLETGIRQKSSF